jgi:hypothetical protein
LGQRLAASPKQGHFDKFDEGKSYLPAVFADNGARARPIKAAPFGSAKTFVALPSLVARCQQNKQIRASSEWRRCQLMALVSLGIWKEK